MREGWELKTLGEVVNISRKSTPPSAMEGESVELYSIPGFDSGIFPQVVSPATIGSSKTKIQSEAVLVSLLNPRIPRVEIARGGSFCSTEFAVVHPSSSVSLKYLFLILQSPTFSNFLESHSKGTTGSRKRSKREDILRFPAQIPPLHEQKRIVDLMDSVDAAISAAQAEVDATVAMKGRILAKKLGSPESDWERVTFGEVAETLLGKALSRGEGQTEGGTPYLRYANVSWGAIDTGDLNRMTFTESEARKYSLRIGDLLVAEARHVGKCAVVMEPLDGICYQNSLHRVRADEGRTSTSFLALVLRHLVNDGTVARFSTAQTIPHLSQGRLRSLPFDLPPLHVQQSIVATMAALTASETTAQISLDRLRELRSSMLSVLLSGEHEIPDSYDQFLSDSEEVHAG